MIEKIAFGKTGHQSSRVIFGAAAFFSTSQERATRVLDLLLEFGVNHIDTAASYGHSEVTLAPLLAGRREDFFLATKTGERSGAAARESLERSLERLRVESVDLIQLHNLVDESEWEEAMGPSGALEALIAARDEGLVRFLGVTGHGTQVAQMHHRSLERFPFDSVLLPYSFSMMRLPDYAADFERLLEVCTERGVAVQTIKSMARRRWPQTPERRFSWYEPLPDEESVRSAVHWTLARPGIFLNSSSDTRLLPIVLDAASRPEAAPSAAEMTAQAQRLGIEPLFGGELGDRI